MELDLECDVSGWLLVLELKGQSDIPDFTLADAKNGRGSLTHDLQFVWAIWLLLIDHGDFHLRGTDLHGL